MFYAGLIIMFVVSIWDIVLPPQRVCLSADMAQEGKGNA